MKRSVSGPPPSTWRISASDQTKNSPSSDLPSGRLGVGVGRRIEAAVGRGHLAQHVVQRLARDAGEVGAPRHLVRLGVGDDQQRVVVEHLLEVRHQPARVGGVAVEAAAELIVHAAGRHLLQRQRRHQQRHVVAVRAVFARSSRRIGMFDGNLGARRTPPSRSSNRRLNTVTVSGDQRRRRGQASGGRGRRVRFHPGADGARPAPRSRAPTRSGSEA